jgi:hypothetical protein
VVNVATLHTRAIALITIFPADSFAQLFKALAPYVEALGIVRLLRIIAEENEGFQGGDGVQFLVDAPQNIIEEWLELYRNVTAGRCW